MFNEGDVVRNKRNIKGRVVAVIDEMIYVLFDNGGGGWFDRIEDHRLTKAAE